MTTTHTPGPWSVGYTRRMATDPRLTFYETAVHVGEGASRGNCLASVSLGGECATDASVEAVEANARLIAASPTMYDYIADRAKEGDERAKAIIASIGND